MKLTVFLLLTGMILCVPEVIHAQNTQHKTITLTTANFDETIKTGITLVDFWATWCSPCIMQGPVIDEIADSLNGKVKVGKVDTDKHPSLTRRFGIYSIPTTIIFVDGVAMNKASGYQSYDQLMARIKVYLKD